DPKMKPKPPSTLQVRLPTLMPAGAGGVLEATTIGASGGSSGCGGRGRGTTSGSACAPARVTSTLMPQLWTGVSASATGTPATKALSVGLAGAFAAASTRSAARQNACASATRRSSALDAMSVLKRL